MRPCFGEIEYKEKVMSVCKPLWGSEIVNYNAEFHLDFQICNLALYSFFII